MTEGMKNCVLQISYQTHFDQSEVDVAHVDPHLTLDLASPSTEISGLFPHPYPHYEAQNNADQCLNNVRISNDVHPKPKYYETCDDAN
jgi:hypothetical protein